jgi:uncharacterized protein (TIGR00290 family)
MSTKGVRFEWDGEKDKENQERHPRMPQRTLLSWSSGKDSAWALHVLRRDPGIDVIGLFTTVNQTHHRVAMHAVRVELLQRQAEAAGLPLHMLPIPDPCSNEEYAAVMKRFVEEARIQGVEYMAFGDLFLADVRSYRENQLKDTGITPIFPLWQIPTERLIDEMLSGGLGAFLTCVDPRQLSANFAGRRLDRTLLGEFPETVDPCGENGEFHTFAFDGPMFQKPVEVRVGEVVQRDGFVFADLLFA